MFWDNYIKYTAAYEKVPSNTKASKFSPNMCCKQNQYMYAAE